METPGEHAAADRPGPKDGRQDSREGFRKLRKLARLIRTRSFRRALSRRVAAAIEHEEVPFLHDHKTVIDVGAHHGQFAIFARERFPRARVYCFEPLPEALRVFRGVLGEDPQVKLFSLALGSEVSTSQAMHVSKLDDSSSLLPIMPRYTTAFPGTDEDASVAVPVSTLDQVMEPEAAKRPCLLKIDVQGFELQVLRGGERTLDSVDELLIECSFVELYAGQALAGELISHMWARGFRLVGVFGMKRDLAGRCLQADLLFDRGQ